MQTFDIIVLIPIAYFAYKGFQSGIVKEVLSIVGVVLAVFLTINYLEAFSGFIKEFFNLADDFNAFAWGVILFITVLIITSILTWTISKLLKAINLSAINKLLGLLFGALKASILVSIILILLSGFNLPKKETRKSSVSYATIIQVAPTTYNLIAKVYPDAENFSQKLKKTIDENNPLKQFNF